MAGWFYGMDGVQAGPVEEGELRALIASGIILSDTLLWREGMPGWLPLQQLQAGGVYPGTLPAPAYGGLPPPTCGMAVGSLVFGALSIATCLFFLGIPAVVLGHLSLHRIAHAGVPMAGRGIAMAGLLAGYATSALFLAICGHLIFALSRAL